MGATIGLMAGDDKGVGGRAREAGKRGGGRWGGGTREQCLIWLVTRGEGGPGRRARGGRLGGAPEQCGSNKACTGSPNNWSALAGDEGGRRGGAGPGRRATESSAGATRRSLLKT